MSMWNDEMIERLRHLWLEEGLSASQIADELGQGCTKNAVIGKIHRLKLQKEGNRVSRPRTAAKPRTASRGVSRPRRTVAKTAARNMDQFFANRVIPETVPGIPFLLPDTNAFGTEALLSLSSNACKYPVGDPMSPDFRFCGAHAEGVYCEHHHAIAYRGSSSRLTAPERERRYA